MISGNIRKGCGKSESCRTRKQGMLPAVIYGAHKNNLNVEIGTMEFVNEIRKKGEHSVLELDIDGTTEKVMVKELQKDPVSHKPVHLDFQRIESGQMVHTRVPIIITGDKSFKNTNDIVQIQQPEVEIECFPDRLPRCIMVDVSNLSPGGKISIKDLMVPEGVNIIGNPASVIIATGKSAASMTVPQEKEEAPAVYA